VQWIYDLPSWIFGVIIMAAFVAIACGGHSLIRRHFPTELLKGHNDVAGFIAAIVGTVYAVLLSFVVIVVWQEFDNASSYVQREASAVTDLYHLAYGLPPKQRALLQLRLRTYTNVMIDDEWPRMKRGLESARGDLVGNDILREVISLTPKTEDERQIRSEALRNIQVFFDARHDRLNANATSVPNILWFTLILGAVITIGFTFFFGTKNGGAQLIMTGGLAALIAIMFALIIQLDLPFRGNTRVEPDAFIRFQNEMATSGENAYRP